MKKLFSKKTIMGLATLSAIALITGCVQKIDETIPKTITENVEYTNVLGAYSCQTNQATNVSEVENEANIINFTANYHFKNGVIEVADVKIPKLNKEFALNYDPSYSDGLQFKNDVITFTLSSPFNLSDNKSFARSYPIMITEKGVGEDKILVKNCETVTTTKQDVKSSRTYANSAYYDQFKK